MTECMHFYICFPVRCVVLESYVNRRKSKESFDCWEYSKSYLTWQKIGQSAFTQSKCSSWHCVMLLSSQQKWPMCLYDLSLTLSDNLFTQMPPTPCPLLKHFMVLSHLPSTTHTHGAESSPISSPLASAPPPTTPFAPSPSFGKSHSPAPANLALLFSTLLPPGTRSTWTAHH